MTSSPTITTNSTTTTTTTTTTSCSSLWSQELDHPAAHGVAVWALASSNIGSQVPYHLDYAEQIRYDYNVIVPPLLAGTLHCTPINDKTIDPDEQDNPNGLQIGELGCLEAFDNDVISIPANDNHCQEGYDTCREGIHHM